MNLDYRSILKKRKKLFFRKSWQSKGDLFLPIRFTNMTIWADTTKAVKGEAHVDSNYSGFCVRFVEPTRKITRSKQDPNLSYAIFKTCLNSLWKWTDRSPIYAVWDSSYVKDDKNRRLKVREGKNLLFWNEYLSIYTKTWFLPLKKDSCFKIFPACIGHFPRDYG
jgi:hypothetical protein